MGTPVQSSGTLKSPCCSSLPSRNEGVHGPLKEDWDRALPGEWQDGTAPRAAHRQTAVTEGRDGNKSPPGAWRGGGPP